MDHLGVDLDALAEFGFAGAEPPAGVFEVGDAGVEVLECCGDAVAGGAAE